jgi:hypothetical protein
MKFSHCHSAFAWSNLALATANSFLETTFLSDKWCFVLLSLSLYFGYCFWYSASYVGNILNNNWPLSHIDLHQHKFFARTLFQSSDFDVFNRPNLRNIFFWNEVSIVMGLVTENVSATSFSSFLSYNSLSLLGRLAQIKCDSLHDSLWIEYLIDWI